MRKMAAMGEGGSPPLLLDMPHIPPYRLIAAQWKFFQRFQVGFPNSSP